MSKAVLILDYIDEEDIEELRADVILDLYGDSYGFYKNMTLKPMPKKLEFKTDRLTLKSNMDEIDNYIKNLGYERVGNIHDTIGGYNACIDEIIGEEE